MATHRNPTPFADDADYWDAVVEHVLAVLRRHDAAASSPVDAEELSHLQAREERLLDVVRARVEATRNTGRKLAIDTVRERFDLDVFEIAILKILVVFTLASAKVADAGRLFGPSVDELLDLLGLGIAEKVRRLKAFGPDGRLVASGLVHVQEGDGDPRLPARTLGAWVCVTETALEVLVGLRPVDDLA